MSKLLRKKLLNMIIAIVEKMSEKSLLNHCLVRTADVFDPVFMVSYTQLDLRSKIKKLLTHLVSLKVVSPNLAKKALPHYSDLVTTLTQDHFEKAKAFDCKESRMDDFFFRKITLNIPNELKSILTLLYCSSGDVSHGQASVERGFNTNKSISKVNLSENSMVSRKMIIDHMQKNSLRPSTAEITGKLIKSVKCARQRYHIDLKEQKKKTQSDARDIQLQILSAEMKELTQKKQLLEDSCKKLDNELIQLITEAEEKNDMKLVIKGNALKRKSEENKSQIGTLEETIKILQDKRRKLV